MKWFLYLFFGAFVTTGCASGQDPVPATFKVGLYGSAWIDWVVDNSDSIDFMVYQAGPTRPVNVIERDLRNLEAASVDAYVVIRLFEGGERTTPAPNDSAENYLGRARELIQLAESSQVVAFSLDEENIFWGGRDRVLAELYGQLKEQDDSVALFQWYSSARRPNPPGGRWPNLPADGWIFDQYAMAASDYEEYLGAMSKLDRPTVSVVWASPNWPAGSAGRNRDTDWWDDEGWRKFYARVAANTRFNIPTAFFIYDVDESGRVMPLWQAGEQCAVDFVTKFTAITLPYISNNAPIDDVVPAVRPDWIPIGCAATVAKR